MTTTADYKARLIPVTVHVNGEGCSIEADGAAYDDGSLMGAYLREELTGFVGYADLQVVAPLICHGWLA